MHSSTCGCDTEPTVRGAGKPRQDHEQEGRNKALANPIRTGVVALRYSMRMVVLPFMFVLNPQLLLIGVSGVGHTLVTLASATLAGFAFISVNQGWLLVRSSTVERLVMLLSVLMLFHPALFMDPLFEPHRRLNGAAAEAAIVAAPESAEMRVFLSGTTLEGETVERGVLLPLGAAAGGAVQRLAAGGIESERSDTGFTVTGVAFGSRAARLDIAAGFRIHAVEIPNDRPAREWMFVPALLLIGWVVQRQRRRRTG